MDLCYICKNPCDKRDIISCANFLYDDVRRKTPYSGLMNKTFYNGFIPIRYISIGDNNG